LRDDRFVARVRRVVREIQEVLPGDDRARRIFAPAGQVIRRVGVVEDWRSGIGLPSGPSRSFNR